MWLILQAGVLERALGLPQAKSRKRPFLKIILDVLLGRTHLRETGYLRPSDRKSPTNTKGEQLASTAPRVWENGHAYIQDLVGQIRNGLDIMQANLRLSHLKVKVTAREWKVKKGKGGSPSASTTVAPAPARAPAGGALQHEQVSIDQEAGRQGPAAEQRARQQLLEQLEPPELLPEEKVPAFENQRSDQPGLPQVPPGGVPARPTVVRDRDGDADPSCSEHEEVPPLFPFLLPHDDGDLEEPVLDPFARPLDALDDHYKLTGPQQEFHLGLVHGVESIAPVVDVPASSPSPHPSQRTQRKRRAEASAGEESKSKKQRHKASDIPLETLQLAGTDLMRLTVARMEQLLSEFGVKMPSRARKREYVERLSQALMNAQQ